ncbi:hypothetical protein [Tanticharoenia sakaeratensis]|nr:hypothetical protein [Tanticharoenia sakaeratensis]
MGNDRRDQHSFQRFTDRKFPEMSAVAISSARDRLLDAIKREFMPLRFASEMLARASEKTPRAAQNWLAGKNAPDAEALINLMAACNSIADEVNALVAERKAARERQACPGSD